MQYLALLRGINVSGQKKILMADLKSFFESNGFNNVTTYIQSGNVIFESSIREKEKLQLTLETMIEKKYSFHVPIELRTNAEMNSIVKNCPFTDVDLIENGTKVLVSFLSSQPLKKNIENIKPFVIEPERMEIKGKELYLYCPNGYGKTKLSNNFLEKKLDVKATTRNWKSVSHLINMMSCSRSDLI